VAQLIKVLFHESCFALQLFRGLERGHDAKVAFFEAGLTGFDFVMGHGPLTELTGVGISLLDGDDFVMARVLANGAVELDDAAGGAFDHLEKVIFLVEEDAGDAEVAIFDAGMFEEVVELALGEGLAGLADIDDAIELGSGVGGGFGHLVGCGKLARDRAGVQVTW
jgi:hypothetical protein